MDPATSIGAAVALAFGAVLVMAVANAAAEGTLSRNVAAGLRTAQTLKSDSAWSQSHQQVAPFLRTSAWLVIAFAVLTAAVGVWGSMETVSLAVFILGSVLLIASVIIAGLRAHLFARRLQ